MGRLGDVITPEQKQAAFDATLAPGNILVFWNCPFTTPPKKKYVVMVGRDEEVCLAFVINSDPVKYVTGRPWLAACQLVLRQADYAEFLTRDSSLNCAEVQDSLTAADIAQLLANGEVEYVGLLTDADKVSVKQIVQAATTVTPLHQGIIDTSLT